MRGRLLVLLVCSALSPSFANSATPKHCSSIAQNLLTGTAPQHAFLTAEIPVGAKFMSVSYSARARIAGQVTPWQSCPIAGGACLQPVAAYFPAAPGPNGSGVDNPNTNTRNWSVMVNGPNQMFTGDVWVRMVVDYTTTDTVCVSQQSLQSNANSYAVAFIALPPGKKATNFKTFGAEIQNGSSWQSCGSAPNPPVPQGCDTPGGPIGGLNFILAVQSDEADGVVRVNNRCENKSGHLRRGCRTIVEYTP